jgi:DNA invertase Pin-like site-specific DNA recombinase
MVLTNGKHSQAPTAIARAVIYARVSTDRQAEEGVSLEVQRQQCAEYAQAQGWLITEVFVDDESSYHPREAYNRMMTKAVAREFDAICCYDYSRFGRDIAQSPADVARLELLGVKVVAISTPHAGRLERNIYFTLNDYFSYQTGQKVRPAHIARVQQGFYVGHAPIGYLLVPAAEGKPGRRVPKKLATDPDKAPLVAELFRSYSTGNVSIGDVAKKADALGLVSRHGKRIARSYVHVMLRNHVYLGLTVYGRRSASKFTKKGPRPPEEWIITKGLHDPIIDEATFNRCQELLDRHKVHYGNLTKGKPILSGILYCGTCGAKMQGRSQIRYRGQFTDTPGKPYAYILYACYQHEFFRNCENKTFHAGKPIEEFVQAQVMHLPITEADREAARKEAARIYASQHGDIKAQIKTLQDERDAHAADLKALSWRLVRDEIPAPLYNEMRQEKEKDMAALDKQIASYQAGQAQDKNIDDVLNFLKDVAWSDLDRQAWKETLALLVEKVIVVNKRKYRIEWRPGVEALLRPAP